MYAGKVWSVELIVGPKKKMCQNSTSHFCNKPENPIESLRTGVNGECVLR